MTNMYDELLSDKGNAIEKNLSCNKWCWDIGNAQGKKRISSHIEEYTEKLIQNKS